VAIAVANVTEIYMSGTTLEVAGTLAGGATNETGLYYASTGCYGQSFASAANEMSATITTSLDLSSAGSMVVFRFGHTTGLEVLETVANGGCVVRIGSSSSNYKEFTVGGVGARNPGGCWLTIAIDPSITPTSTTGTPNMAAATFFAIETSLSGEAGGDTDNQFLDMIIAVEGPLSVTGTTTAAGLFADLVAWDNTNKYDLIRDLGGVYNIRGMIEIDSLAGATTITDKGSVVAFAPDEFYNGSAWVDTIDGANMGFKTAKNGAGAVNITLGEKLDGTGTNGVSFIAESGMVFDISDGTVATTHMYGCSVKGADPCSLHDSASECFDCVFDACAMISPSTMVIERPTIKGFAGAATDAALLWHPTNTDITGGQFISAGTGHAIHLEVTGTYSSDGILFSGYAAQGGTATDRAIYNDSGGLVTINVSGGGDSPSYRNGTSASTVVNANVSITFTDMKDNTEVRVYNNATGVELAGIENATAGSVDARTFLASISASTVVDIVIFNIDWVWPPNNRLEAFTWPTSDSSLPIQQVFDRVNENPA